MKKEVTKGWRPKGWEKIVWDNVSRKGGYFNPDIPIIISQDRDLFEAGADAMLTYLLGCGKKDMFEALRVSGALCFNLPGRLLCEEREKRKAGAG